MFDIILSIFCVIGYRLRGSAGEGGWVEKILGFPVGTIIGRLFWCIPFALLMTTTWWHFFPLVVLAYIGVMFGYWGKFDLENPNNRNWKNYALLTLRGAFIPLLVCAFIQDHYWAIAGGALFVPCYLLGGVISKRLKLPLLYGNTEWGEALLATAIITGVML